MLFLDWDTDGLLARFGLMALGCIVFLFVLPRVRRNPALDRLLPGALLWHTAVWMFYAFWMLPYYVETSGADCYGYHMQGLAIARLIRAGDWAAVPWGVSTAATDVITGILYTPFGGDVYGMLFFSAVIGLCGSLYFCLAFAIWTERAQTRTYALIILFLPSFVLWTAIFGKDSWIALGLGLSAYGYSAKLKGLRTGLWHLVAGLTITTVVRPHISVTFAAAMTMAYLWGLTKNRRVSILGKIWMVTMLLVMLAILAVVAQRFLGIEDISADSLAAYGQARGADNDQGGSAVEIQRTHGVSGTLLGFPRGVIRELFEPFPWEVHNLSLGMAAAENLFLLWFVVTHMTRLRKLFRQIVRAPYMLFSSILATALLLIFSLIPNLGLLSRQRVQLLPFVFAPLVAAEAVRKRSGGGVIRQTAPPAPQPAREAVARTV